MLLFRLLFEFQCEFGFWLLQQLALLWLATLHFASMP
jgi:hypothetical protein